MSRLSAEHVHLNLTKYSTNENTNGLVREYFPKGTDFDAAGDERVREVYDAISHRPRKRHGFRTPYEVHHSQTLHLL